MSDPVTIGLGGAAIGALTNKKNPLMGALKIGGLAAGGAALAPMIGLGGAAGASPLSGLLGGSAAQGAGTAAVGEGLTGAALESAMMGSALNPALATPFGATQFGAAAERMMGNPMVGMGASMLGKGMMGGEQPQQMPMPAPMMPQPRQQAAAPFSSLMPQDPFMQGYLNPQMGRGFQIGRGWRG
jgi:hypothetical protein